ncbi:lactate racemase domain-containing protein [uncultured Tessaracoccus sp.]|uniref:lactate racemase domain-containing protein n=1 Tax=uncultured Tessaracoccus sp. TaxID=905023 RepID=UPI0025EB083B|nr:lactate racemase domain-containing protein [uncultured Tessaracoccus sp.]
MSRPGFVIEVDDRAPALLTLSGQQLGLRRLGIGTQVVYPAEATPSNNPLQLVDAALEAPSGGETLAERLSPETRLTLVVLDDERVRPRMRFDVRRGIVERVLEVAARAGVDDVAIVIAGGLNKRWSPYDITRVLGDRVATSFQPDGRIESHDITAPDLVALGEVDGHEVRCNRRVAESDLVVTIGAQFGSASFCPISSGLADVATLRRLGGVDPATPFATAVRDLFVDRLPVFSVQAVLGQPYLGGLLRYAWQREWEWTFPDQMAFAAARQLGALAPKVAGRLLHATPVADYAVLDVLGGDPASTFQQAEGVWQAANTVPIPKQADVVVTSVWGGSFDDGDPVGSPINAAQHALVRRMGSHLERPYGREGAVAIAFHPLVPRFSNRRQSSASDFFAQVLPTTVDPAHMQEFEEAACQDQWYVDLYRKQFADHPLRTFQSWYRVRAATERFADVIWVGGNRRTADLFGHRAATTYADALEIASDKVGRTPVISYLHAPGLPLGDVR